MSHDIAENVFRFRISPRWGDLDAMNHVNNATYLRYLEEARIQWLNAQDTAWFDGERAPVLASATVNYRLPIEYPSEIDIELFATRIGTSSLTIGHRMVDAANARLHCDGQVVVVWIDRKTGKPAPLPDSIRSAAERIASPD
ncbi:acyl-CoA thioesterase [Solilutibacter tolerans]|uniref:Acyl-CoA thioester hydrolase n=1 Tax=Solilutibacter tolerans TaxID=1604334 RepID=A0A1N6TAU3_9GAMM|nr:thioesterase family protein [Lysobacter tolerans]SIQ50482.1 acyl-CoA thioester hydrolase [Lysobacter tolerans]